MALDCPLKDVVSHAELTSEHMMTLDKLGGLHYNGKDLYLEIKAVSLEGRRGGGRGERGDWREGEGVGGKERVWEERRGRRGVEGEGGMERGEGLIGMETWRNPRMSNNSRGEGRRGIPNNYQ